MIFPNPVKDVFEVSSTEKMNNIKVFSSIGVEIINTNVDGMKSNIDMSLFPEGFYIIQIYQKNKIINKKIIKQK